MDCVVILFRKKLTPMQPDPTVPSPKPSWNEALKIMASTSFLNQLLHFPKDTINDEMVELLEPYLTMEDYNMTTAKRVCGDVAGTAHPTVCIRDLNNLNSWFGFRLYQF